jgi:hypothetical protein
MAYHKMILIDTKPFDYDIHLSLFAQPMDSWEHCVTNALHPSSLSTPESTMFLKIPSLNLKTRSKHFENFQDFHSVPKTVL